ncbi:hypothetical protein SCLCIDRAFT_1218416 [Scleroderma citrinum Foug A]|uniref:Uncharacterized protein n=1 Tax=Scleroderma citrinum Foug A TaxID=1036808 RepID=A0A0C3DDE2_9AGAM|nr:hypothetical protein SCLCIDRAFT_1218416 [Scleroderma citrinum Foug A]
MTDMTTLATTTIHLDCHLDNRHDRSLQRIGFVHSWSGHLEGFSCNGERQALQ